MGECKSVIRNVPLIQGQYVAIVAPIACNYFAILSCGPGGAMRSSDPDNPAAEYSMSAYGGYALIGQPHTMYRFVAGETVTHLKSLDGTGPAIVEFTL
jgi:hypothetical protein